MFWGKKDRIRWGNGVPIHCGNQKGNVTFFPLCFCRGRKVAIMRILGKKTGMDAAGKNNFRHNLHDGLVGVVRMGFGV